MSAIQPHEYLFASRQLYCFVTDSTGFIYYINQLAEHYLKLSPGNAVGRDVCSIAPSDVISLSHCCADGVQREIVWEVQPVQQQNNKVLYQWIAPAIKNMQPVIKTESNSCDLSGQFQKREQFYCSLIAKSLDGILLTDAAGIITFATPSIRRILGYEPEDVVGKKSFLFVHPDDQNWAYQSFQKEVTENPEIKFIVVRLLKKNGDWLWCMVRGNNLLDYAPVNSIVIYLHDDTLRKQTNDALKQSEQRFRSLIADLHLGVMLLDIQGNITLANKAVAAIVNAAEDKLIGQNALAIATGAMYENGKLFQEEDMPLVRAIKTKKPIRNVVMGINNGGQEGKTWLLINTDPVLDENNNILYIICSINNITERKKLEQKLISGKISQQKLITQATIDGQEKERKEIGKELHDNIGQQLTTIKLFLDLAKTTADDNTNEMISLALKGVSDVINETRRMSRALVPPSLGDLGLIESVNDLVDSMSRTQQLKIRFDYFNFKEEALSDNKKLMIFRIVQEQLNNIVKHACAENVTIVLSNNKTYLLLEIKDDGHGFNLAKTRKGLGLTSIKNRAELFGGKKEIITAPGQGCTLKISIPKSCKEAEGK